MNTSASRLLFVISAPSGAGKTTLCSRLLQEFPDLRLSISCTTRAPRGQEQDGKEYFFLTTAEFENQIKNGRFAEWAQVHGYYYGTSKDTIEDAFQGGHPLLLDIDVQGASSLKKAFPRESILIFVSPPSLMVLEQRLRSRGTDSEETIRKRMNNAQKEMARQDEFQYVLVNDDLEKTYAELRRIIIQHIELGTP